MKLVGVCAFVRVCERVCVCVCMQLKYGKGQSFARRWMSETFVRVRFSSTGLRTGVGDVSATPTAARSRQSPMNNETKTETHTEIRVSSPANQ